VNAGFLSIIQTKEFKFLSVKSWLAAALLFAATGICGHAGRPSSASETGCTLRIHVDGLRDSKGVVGAAIFKSPDGWPEDMSKTVNHWPTPIPAGAHEATAVLKNLPPGDYGVVAIHDENKNQKLDRNLIGIPKEEFGFANNPHVGLSAPPFSPAVVHVTCPVTETDIHLIRK
jgi:uncharacterized protein (DUF2141 family)